MGHTHYNELANDGRTIFMATRSTGQVEEGPPGFSVAAVDGRGVSWRFKPLDAAWPFVLVPCPPARRRAPDAGRAGGRTGVARAKVLGDVPVGVVEVQADDGPWAPMMPAPALAAVWEAPIPHGSRCVVVRARDAAGRVDEDRVEPAGPGWRMPERHVAGSDADRVGAWPEKGIPGTQLGPNRRGRRW